ncbi:hypothetical protein EDD64_11455 [Effusibacillus lacus]|nr:hypothetical protein EDD64_11455 [Effusibacillus lacus]
MRKLLVITSAFLFLAGCSPGAENRIQPAEQRPQQNAQGQQDSQSVHIKGRWSTVIKV